MLTVEEKEQVIATIEAIFWTHVDAANKVLRETPAVVVAKEIESIHIDALGVRKTKITQGVVVGDLGAREAIRLMGDLTASL